MKPLLLLLSFALFASAFAQDLSKRVTYTTAASPAKKVVDDLSGKVGVRLMVAPQTADEVLAINAKGVTLQELMDRIATVVHGEWSKEDEGYRLIRPIQFLEDERAERATKDGAALRTAIDKRLKDQGAPGAFDSHAATALAAKLRQVEEQWEGKPQQPFQMQMEYEAGPPGRALNRLLSLMDAKALGELPESRRVVFSNKPTPTQRPFPPAAAKILEDYVREHNLWSDTLRATASLRHGPEQPIYKYNNPVGDRSKILLAMTRSPFSLGTRCEFILAGADGMVADRLEATIEGDYDRRPDPGLTRGLNLSAKLPLRPQTVKLAKMLGFYTGNTPRLTESELDPEVMKALLSPDKVDPLSFASTDVLMEIAKAKGVNLVANVPDVLFVMNLAIGGMRQATFGSFVSTFGFYHAVAKEKDGWLMVSPEYPALSEPDRVDRPALGTLLRACKASHRAGLDDLANYARTGPILSLEFLATPIAALVESTLASALTRWDLLNYRFYGELTSTQRQQAEVPMSSLNAKQMQVLDTLLNTAARPLYVLGPSGAINRSDTIARETTEALPNGIPKTGVLHLSNHEDSVVYLVEPFGGTATDAKGLAGILYRHQHPEIYPPDNSYKISFDKFQSARRKTIDLKFAFTPTVGILRTLTDVSKRGAVTALADLPADFRADLKRELANQAKEAQNTPPPVKNPPPPRP